MGLVDTAVMGQVSAEAQAAVGLGNSLTFTLCFMGMGVMLAMDPLIGHAVGAGDFKLARHWYEQSNWLALGVGASLMLPVALSPLLLPLFGVDAAVATEAREYVWWRLPAVLGLMLFVGARAYLQGLGHTRPIFLAMALANVANLVLAVALVFGVGPLPALGSRGAAIATTLCTFGQWAVLLPAIAAASRTKRRRHASPDRKALGIALKLGTPIGMHMLAEGGVFTLAGVLAARLGAQSSAAHQSALTWASVTFCVTAGIGSAAATRVSWARGAGNFERAREAGNVALVAAASFMSMCSAVFWLMPDVFARLMTRFPDVQPITRSLLVVVAAFQIADGLQAVGAGAMRGASMTRFTFVANMVGHWLIGLPVAWLLSEHLKLGVTGIWWGLCAGLTAVAVALVWRWGSSDLRHSDS